jgi:flagellar hook-associated protein 1 FlgK
MSDLLSIGRSGVLAYRAALTAVGENVANANTDGYTRRSVTITESGVSSSTNYQYRSNANFGGADVNSVQRVYDDYKANYARLATSDAAKSDTKSQWLQTTETALDDSDVGLGVKMSSVFTSAESLATDVNSAPIARR